MSATATRVAALEAFAEDVVALLAKHGLGRRRGRKVKEAATAAVVVRRRRTPIVEGDGHAEVSE